MSESASQSLRQLVLELYDDLGREIAAAGPVCELSGRCCRFEEFGHRLYISRPEAEILLADGLPDGCDPAEAVADRNRCPFQINRLCTAHGTRPLGCRVYFCDPTYQAQLPILSEQYVRRMKQLHDSLDVPWEYRSLHEFLADYTNRRADQPEQPVDSPPEGS